MGAGRNCVDCLEMMSGREGSWRILVILVTEVLIHLFPSCPSGLRGSLSFPIVPGARPLATETCLAKLLIQWILYFVWTVQIFYIFCTGSVWSISLPCLIYPSSLFSVKWWIKRDTLKSATLAGGLIWAEGISVFNRHRKSSFHSNVCGCINSGYFCCCMIKTQLTLLWDKQEYTGSQLESKGGGISSWGKACVNPEPLITSRRCNLSTFTHPQVLPPSSLNKFAPVGSLVVGKQGCRCKRLFDLVLLIFFPWGETNNVHPSSLIPIHKLTNQGMVPQKLTL